MLFHFFFILRNDEPFFFILFFYVRMVTLKSGASSFEQALVIKVEGCNNLLLIPYLSPSIFEKWSTQQQNIKGIKWN